MSKLTDLFKVLSDDTRLRIINLLNKQDLCVCEMAPILELSQPKISKHIARLRAINLVTTKRNEQYIYYSLDRTNTEFMSIIDSVLHLNNTELLEDTKNLEKVETFVCSK